MGGIWYAGLRSSAAPGAAPARRPQYGHKIKELEHQVQRLSLMNQALWELLCDKLDLADADLEQKAYEVDVRDGVQDGRITDTAIQCPTCGRVSASKHYKCLYCGQTFQKPVMG